MKFTITISGKKYKLKYFEYIAYHALQRMERLEKKIDSLEKELKKGFQDNSQECSTTANSGSN